MAFDGLVLRGVVHELSACVGGRIHKIHQPNEHELLIAVRAKGATKRLLLSANPTYPRLHWTERAYVNPPEAPMFCMLLRKHCENGVVEAIRQVGAERIVHIDVRSRDELGDARVKRIVFEIMGKHSNIILVDPASGTVLDAIKRVTPAVSSYRTVLPGQPYVPPPEQFKRNPLEATEAEVKAALTAAAEADGGETGANAWANRLVAAFIGVSPLAARAIVLSAGDRSADSVARRFAEAMGRLRSHRYEPNIVETEDGKTFFSVVSLAALGGRRTVFPSVNECLEAYFGDKAERDLVKQKSADLSRLLNNEKTKNENKLKKLRETLEEAREADKYRIYGELLNAYMHLIRKGDERIELANFYDEEGRTAVIPLDPTLTPSENAQQYFKKYQKMRNSVKAVEEQIRQTEEEIRYLESLLQQIADADLPDLEEIRAELEEGGYVRKSGRREDRRSRKSGEPRLHGYLSSEGVPIYVGKNNLQNEYLTHRFARPSDTWLHAKEIPGSHVVIRAESYGEQTLAEAANLAAYFSKGKHSSNVPVDYTLIRHVRKPNGAKPGFVIYGKQQTLYVTPDEEKVKGMTELPANRPPGRPRESGG